MPRLRTILISSLFGLAAGGFALASGQDGADGRAPVARQRSNPPRGQAAAPVNEADQARMQLLLKQWEGQSAKLQTLEVDVYRIDRNPAWWDDEEHFIGHAAFKTPQLAYLDFRKVALQPQSEPNDKNQKKLVPKRDRNNQIVSAPYQTIVCTGSEVWDYHSEDWQVFVYTLDSDSRKRAIEEGPLPFLFNMKADEVQRRYEMTLAGEDKERYLVKVKPLFDEEKERFSTAWIYLDKTYLLPKRIVLRAPDGNSTQDFTLSHQKANEKVDPRYFQGVNPGKKWKLYRNPGGNGPASPPANARARRRQPPGQSAQRPTAADDGQPR
jgi:TIGR03009 family protein